MNFRKPLAAVLCLFLSLASWTSAAETIHFGANESPPYWSSIMPKQGLCGEILQALSAEAGLNAEVTFKPLKRLIENTHNNDLGNPVFYIKEQDFAGIIPIALYQASFYYYQPNHLEKITLNKLTDLKQYKIGILSGSLIDQQTFERAGIQFKTSYSQASIFKKLKLGRIDLAIEIDFIAEQMIKQLYPMQRQDFAHISITHKPEAIAIMINEEMPGAKQIALRYRKALKNIIADGRYQAILTKYYQGIAMPNNWYEELARYDRLYNFDLDE